MDQRHVAAAGVDQGLQVGVAPMPAGLAPHQHADIAGAQRGPRGRQLVVVGAHPLDLGWSEGKNHPAARHADPRHAAGRGGAAYRHRGRQQPASAADRADRRLTPNDVGSRDHPPARRVAGRARQARRPRRSARRLGRFAPRRGDLAFGEAIPDSPSARRAHAWQVRAQARACAVSVITFERRLLSH